MGGRKGLALFTKVSAVLERRIGGGHLLDRLEFARLEQLDDAGAAASPSAAKLPIDRWMTWRLSITSGVIFACK